MASGAYDPETWHDFFVAAAGAAAALSGLIFSIIFSIAASNAWILLVEVLR
jgi:hypothetical protein